MTNEDNRHHDASLFQKLKIRFLTALKLTDVPTVRLYNGYGNKTHCFLYGHAFSFSPLPRTKYRNHFLLNAFALLRLFMVKTMKGAVISFNWDGKEYTTLSEQDGFFKFEWQPSRLIDGGFHPVEVTMIDRNGHVLSLSKALLVIPYSNQFSFISDIDDTFLISHSSNLRKRLFVLFTENAMSRKPFEGVVNHYHLLSGAGTMNNTTNPFFYVSSSEWNLYHYIKDFSANHKMPEGVYLLNQVKTFSQVFKTGQNNHGTKFMRIVRIMEAYPEQQFILLGDDSQRDPFIYSSVVSHFKGQIHCVYIRKTTKKTKPDVETKLKEIEAAGVPFCYFAHSAEAIMHSRAIGLLNHA